MTEQPVEYVDKKTFNNALSALRNEFFNLPIGKTIQQLQSEAESYRRTNLNANQLLNNLKAFEDISSKANEELSTIRSIKEKTENIHDNVIILQQATENIKNRCADTQTILTSSALASSFYKRVESLESSSKCWMTLLIVDLIILFIIAFYRIYNMQSILNSPDPSVKLFLINLSMSFAIAAPSIWVATLATKRISALFRLKEDYAYKASAAAAFEGFNQSVEYIDNHELKVKLMQMLILRYGQDPLRTFNKDDEDSSLMDFVQKVPEIAKTVIGTNNP